MLLEQWDDDDGVFTALAFVDRDTVGQLDFGELAFGIFDDITGELDGDTRAVGGNTANDAHVAVEDIFVVVIASLNDFIADTKGAATVGNFGGQWLACFFRENGFVWRARSRGRNGVWIQRWFLG